jgi:hypothetical protein
MNTRRGIRVAVLRYALVVNSSDMQVNCIHGR